MLHEKKEVIELLLSARSDNFNMIWPSKDEREDYEINGFIENYKSIPGGREFVIVERREKPDYFVEDMTTGDCFGVELTSVYLTDQSVPDEHIPTLRNSIGENIPLVSSEMEQFNRRIVEAIKNKISKAKNGYDLRYPLILSLYVNEYRSIFMNRRHWEKTINENKEVFDFISPFSEIFFWALANGDALLVRHKEDV